MDRIIRRAEQEDQEALVECVQAAYSKYIERIGKKPAPMLADYKALIDQGMVYVLTDTKEVRGVLVMMPQGRNMVVENVAVDPRFQGQGLGRTLMAFVEQQARQEQLDEIHLYTNEVMTENLLFYQKLRFEEIGRHMQNGYRRVFLRKRLQVTTETRTSLVHILETQRLKLLPFTLELKKARLAERARLAELLEVDIPEAWPGADLLEALPVFIEVMEKDPTGLVWDGIIIHKAEQRAIGGIGFHGGPDAAGMVEIGYNIIPAYEGQGYATEMVRRVIEWAFQTPDIEVITAECLDDNIGSIRVLEKVGMRRLALEGNRLKWELRK